MAQRHQDWIEITPVLGIGGDIGEQIQSCSDERTRGRDTYRTREQRFFARRLDVFSRHAVKAGKRRTWRQRLRRQLHREQFQVTTFGALIAHRSAGKECPGEYCAKSGADTDDSEPPDYSRSRPIERQCADKDKQSRRAGCDPETQMSDVRINAEHRMTHAGRGCRLANRRKYDAVLPRAPAAPRGTSVRPRAGSLWPPAQRPRPDS